MVLDALLRLTNMASPIAQPTVTPSATNARIMMTIAAIALSELRPGDTGPGSVGVLGPGSVVSVPVCEFEVSSGVTVLVEGPSASTYVQ